MLKSLGKRKSSDQKSGSPVKATIHFSKSSYIAGDTVSGRLTLVYCPERSPEKGVSSPTKSRTLCATAVQLQVSGHEGKTATKSVSMPTAHLFRTYTIAGQKDPQEDVNEEHQHLREQEYLRSNARYAPLNGVVLSTAPGDTNETGRLQTRDTSEVKPTKAASSRGSDEQNGSEPQSPGLVPLSMNGDLVLKEGERYVVPFSFPLPPWLPPSYYCEFEEVTASLEYTVQVLLKTTEVSRIPEDVILREPFLVISSIPLRELLQCHERANLKPAFTLRYRFRQFHSNALRRLVSPGPQSPIDVTVEFLSSTTVLLKDRRKKVAAMLHPEVAVVGGAAGATESEPGSPAAGVTVMGNVVDPNGDSTPHKKRKMSSSEARTPAPDPVEYIYLRVNVANGTDTRTMDNTKSGGDAVKTIRIELQARARTTLGNRDLVSEPLILAQAEVGGNVPLGTSNVFKVKLALNTNQFRRAKSSGGPRLSPPTNISSAQITVSTSLVFSFPGLETIAEDLPAANVVVLAEAIDETNRVPYLPNDWRKYESFTDNYESRERLSS